MSVPRFLWVGYKTHRSQEERDRFLHFESPSAALNYLRRFLSDPLQMNTLRALLAANGQDVRRLKDPAVIQKAAEFLAAGKLRVLERRLLSVSSTGSEVAAGSVQEQEQQSAATAPPPKSEKSWIEIRLVDAKGKPVPNERYRIKLPDGLVQEGRLDAFGYAELYDINPGTCEVTFLDLDGDSWNRIS